MSDLNKKLTIGSFLYRAIIVLYAIFVILAPIGTILLKKSYFLNLHINIPQPAIDWITYLYRYPCSFLYAFPINLIIGYGLLRRRFWARYSVIAVMLTYPLYILVQIMWWGLQSIQIQATIIQILFIFLTLLYFSKEEVSTLFGKAHKLKIISWHGLLLGFIILFALIPIIISLSFKVLVIYFSEEPFFQKKPEVIYLKEKLQENLFEKYRKVELLNISFSIPKDFAIRELGGGKENSNAWVVFLQDKGTHKKGFITLRNINPFETIFETGFGATFKKSTGLRNNFELEKLLSTNDWNPVVGIMRAIANPSNEPYNRREIHINDLKGFLSTRECKNKHIHSEFSLYKNTAEVSGTITINKTDFNEEEIMTILTSIEFLDTSKPNLAYNHYKKGLEFYNKEDFIEAQFEFAEAYYLSPDNPEYIYMFAESLAQKGAIKYKEIKKHLDVVLKIAPEHKSAKLLLDEIEPKLTSVPGESSDINEE